MAPEGLTSHVDTSIKQDREAFVREIFEYTQKVYTQSQGSATVKSEPNNPKSLLEKDPEEQINKTVTFLEQDREAFIQDAVKFSQQLYESTTAKREPALRTKNYKGPSTSLTRGTGGESNRNEHTFRRLLPSDTVYALCPHHQQVLKQLESMGFERRRVFRSMRAAGFNVERTADYLVNGIPKIIQVEQLLSSATPTSQNSTARPAVRVCDHAAALPSNVSAEVAKAIQKSIKGKSVAPQLSIAHRKLDTSSKASTLGSSSNKRSGDGYTNNWNNQTPGFKKTGSIEIKSQSDKLLPTARNSKTKQTIEKPSGQNTLSDPQLELEIERIIPTNSSDQNIPLSDADFDRIAKVLQQAGQQDWSLRPRTYALLRMIHAIDLLDDFVKRDCLDIALPYSKANLPKSLSPEQKDRLLKKQGAVMTTAANIEGGPNSKHANFLDNADNHLEALNELGEGGSGQVDRVKSKLSHKFYARKRLKRDETFEKNAEALKFFKREVDHLKKLSHHHLVRYIGSYTDPQYVGIIMKPVADMNFGAFLSQSSFTEKGYECIREAFGCLCAAIIYLHLQQVRHKDIKPANILVKQWKVYITDFGIARDWKALDKSTTTGNHGPISIPYAPPEVMDNKPRNSSADIWSLGCVYLDMVTVLNGETLASKLAYFLSNGNSSKIHSANTVAFEGWIKKLESKKEIAPLDWIKNMTLKNPKARPKPQQLMDRILTFHEELYYGSCCDGKKEEDIAIELRNSDNDDISDSEDQSDAERVAKNALNLAVLEKQLFKAAQTQDVKKLKRWLRRATHLRNHNLRTSAIHHAAANGNKEIVEILIKFGCDLEYKLNGHAPLSSAIWSLQESTTELLARTKIAIDAQDPRNLRSALHLAAQNSFRVGMRILLEAGATVDIRNQYQSTPLHVAVAKGDLASVKLLLRHNASTSPQDQAGDSVLHIAAAHGFDRIVHMLLDQKAEIDAYDTSGKTYQTPLVKAIINNKPAVVQSLLRRGSNVNFQPKVKGHIRPSPLHIAVGNDLLEIVENLLEYKPDLESRDIQNLTPLAVACELPDLKIAERLVTAGADVEAKIEPDNSILTAMVGMRNFHVAQFLIDNKASLDLRSRAGGTLLHYAVDDDHKETIDFLLKNHIDVNAKDSEGLTALMLAAKENRAASVRILKEHGASIDSQDRKGNTALHFAAAKGSTEAASLLLEYGSDPMIPSKLGVDAVGVAEEYERQEISDLIFKALEHAGRVFYDPRWPKFPILLPVLALENGYQITYHNMRPVAIPNAILSTKDSWASASHDISKLMANKEARDRNFTSTNSK